MIAMTHSSDSVWIALLATAFAYNVWAGRSGRELLSSGARRHQTAHPVIVRVFIVATIGHLTGWLPGWADPYHVLCWKPFGYACRSDSR